MYLDTKYNKYKYIDIGAEDPQPKFIGDTVSNYVDPRNVRAPEVLAPEPSFDKRAYPTLDDIFMRVNGAKDLAKIGNNKIYNPNEDPTINNPVPELYGNASPIPTNQSTPKITVGSFANKTVPTANKPATVASQVSTPVTRVAPQNATMKQSVPVEEVTLGSVINNVNKAPLTRRNGGFDEYRKQSALAALRNAGGISPAEGVQRGIIPYEALQYI